MTTEAQIMTNQNPTGLLFSLNPLFTAGSFFIGFLIFQTAFFFGVLKISLVPIQDNMVRMEKRIDKLEGRFDHLESRFDHLESRFDHLESRFDKLENLVLQAIQNQKK